MPRTKAPPQYLLHKPSGRARVRLNGRDIYLGVHGTPESREAYHRIVAAWEKNGRDAPPNDVDLTVREVALRADQQARGGTDLSVNELVLGFIEHAAAYYVKNGRPTSEVLSIKLAMKPLVTLYGRMPGAEFSPLKLKAVREKMVEAKLSRGTVNKRVECIRRMFKWTVEHELVRGEVYHALQAVAGLRRGRTEARETEPVRPVAESHVETILPHVSEQVRAMLRLQLITGMRPGEVIRMRAADLDMPGKLWAYTPSSHKTEHLGRRREIPLGPKAQEIIQPFLTLDRDKFLFSPAEAEAERSGQRRLERKTPMTPSQASRKRNAKRLRPPRDHYTVPSYRRAIGRACDAAFPPPEGLRPQEKETKSAWLQRLKANGHFDEMRAWRRANRFHPNQLRHAFATRVRKAHGIEVARVLLGHADISTTEIYAERDAEIARRVAAKIG